MLEAPPGLASYRQRALAQLDSLIARAEGELTEWAAPLRANPSPGWRGDRLRIAQGRLELLRRSRQFLASTEFAREAAIRH